jgi:pantoate--beta-alanine ligase
VITLDRIADVRKHCDEARRVGGSVGFVPTMGYFHEGHLSLMREARAAHDLVVVSLFVNPTQFGPNEDLDAYPRDFDADVAGAEGVGVDVLFAPTVGEMYPEGTPHTAVHVSGLTDGLCGASRPHHFDGVATVCTKLFSIVGPCTAYFGKKDFQQLRVVHRMAADLDLPVTVIGCSIVREPDGLAMSSRNAYLAPDQRAAATVLSRALRAGIECVTTGERDAARVRDAVVAAIAAEPLAELDYAEVVRAADLRPVERIDVGVATLIALAVRIGRTRLIDNTVLVLDTSSGTRVQFDLEVPTGTGDRPQET